VSYADVTGPVANFNPTGSPFANTSSNGGSGSHSQVQNNSNTSYSSNGSLNSLSPTLTNSFNSPQSTPGSVMQIGGFSIPAAVSSGTPGQMIENLRQMLRSCGYTEEAVAEICSAMNTLANYGMLGLGLGINPSSGSVNVPAMFNSGVNMQAHAGGHHMNGAHMISSLSMGQHNPHGHAHGQYNVSHTSQSSVPGLDHNAQACNNSVQAASSVTSGGGAGGNGIFGAVGSSLSMGMSHGMGGFNSPTGSRQDRHLTMPDGSFDPFRQSSPALGSPGVPSSSGPPPLPINNNSFGLGTGLHSPGGGSQMRKSPTPTDQEHDSSIEHGQNKLEVEIGDNIVGAILGHGGKSLVEIQRISGANIQISKKGIFAPGTRNRIVSITGPTSAVNTAHYLIDQQIQEEESKRARQNATLSNVLR
jgi:RNA-binding protein Nova